MKTELSITVKEPCSENFDNFKSTNDGGYCENCQKEVIDFTRMSNFEIMKRLENTTKTCGRFIQHQINTPIVMNPSRFSWFGKAAVVAVSLFGVAGTTNLHAHKVKLPTITVQTETDSVSPLKLVKLEGVYTVKGKVSDAQNLPLAGVNVVLKGSNIGIQTDFDGKFEFPQKLSEGDVLLFSYIGFDTKEYLVESSEEKLIEINIQFDDTDIILMGDVAVEGVYKSKKNIFQKFIGLFK
ncbi:carboxypeptidase-like regulatory domain-containing protein [Croceitalea sp. P059]|uniref:carboxypeptidase-like regulatory domain-containing protein n=1 Tax=Croceitalea sp. P059 TaxID=3075601 RepID=UPI00288568D5|nr:carboxypeptidase-like regulatory domain-containing protein [Croceitalea sp. P059]MDT0540566.1 carboxypeptidase-like regulatory domain-containing protein [Croceitalea sp. P059]